VAYTPANQWQKSSGEELKDLKLPSGNVALVRAPGLELFLQMGFIPNSLIGFVKAALDENSGKSDKAKVKLQEDKFMSQVIEDPKKIQDLITMANRVALYCVEKPEVLPTPTKTVVKEVDGESVEVEEDDFEACDPDKLYIHQVDLEDKMFIMNFGCGGSRQVGEFRGQLASVVGNPATSKKLVKPTKRTGGSKAKSGSKRS